MNEETRLREIVRQLDRQAARRKPVGREQFVSMCISIASVVVSLIVLVVVSQLGREIGGLKKAVWGLPENVVKKVGEKVQVQQTSMPTGNEKSPSEIIYDPDFKLIHGYWSDDFIDISQRPTMLISEVGVICFGIGGKPQWNVGILERVDDKIWQINIRPYMTPENVDDTDPSGSETLMKLVMTDPDTLKIKFATKHPMKDHFAENGEKFVRWTEENEKTRLKGKEHGR